MFSQKHVEWFTTNYTSHTMSERNMEVKQTSFQESCLLCLWCVCVCVRGSCGRDGWSLFWEGLHFTWRNSVAVEKALPNGNDNCFSVAQRQRRLGVFVSRTAAGRHLFETNDALKNKNTWETASEILTIFSTYWISYVHYIHDTAYKHRYLVLLLRVGASP